MPIVPDDKDWTWVLQRRCPECGFDVSTLPPTSIAPLVRTNADAWRRLLRQPPADLRRRPREDRWAPLEYACHVRDVFSLYDHRLSLMLEEEDPLYPNWDQDETAVAQRYLEQDAATVSIQLRDGAGALAAAFEALTADQWERPGRRGDGAAFTVASFGRYMIHDPVHHLFDVSGERTPQP